MRVVLDTNVLVAAFATRGLCEDAFRIVIAEHELLVSRFILTEFERVLTDKLKMPAARARVIKAFVLDSAEIIEPSKPAKWPKKDPDDRWIVATAIAGEAEVLVSGDRHLLEAATDAPITIIDPRGFWERLK